jgi:hypothetical protein
MNRFTSYAQILAGGSLMEGERAAKIELSMKENKARGKLPLFN